MKAKTVVTGILLLFVGVSVAYLVAKQVGGRPLPAKDSGREESDGAPRSARENPKPDRALVDEVIVYYFHGTYRCTTCRQIEAYAEEAIRANFADELASGKMKWRVVNVEEPENAHFVRDYRLVTRSLVLVGMDGDVEKKWKNLDKVWQYVRSKPEFTNYVVESTKDFMYGSSAGGADG